LVARDRSHFHNARVPQRALSILQGKAGQTALLGWLGLALGCEARAALPVEPLRVHQGEPVQVAAAQPSGGFRLRCRQEYPLGAGGHPQGLLLRDLDGDGHPELVGLTYASGSLQVSSGYGPGPRALPQVRSIELGDWAVGPAWLDSAGKDPATAGLVALAPRKPSELVVLDARQVWAGKSAEAVRWRTPLERRARFLATGDLGHDGRCEVLVTTVDDDLLVFAAQDKSRKLRLCDEHASCLAVLPDGEGFVVGFQGSRRLVYYQPTTENSFGFEPGPAVLLSGLPRKILVCDFDGDGDDEIAVALGDRSLWIFGTGQPGGVRAALAARPLELEVGSVPIELAAGEFDGRPGSEIACLSLAGQELQVFAWQEHSIRTLARAYAGQAPMALACGDLDGDGQADLAIANESALRWSVCFGLPGGGLDVARETRSGRSPHSLAVGDLDGDGRADVVALNALEGSLSVLLGTPAGLAAAQTLIRAPNADELRLADADGDGKLDALWLAKQKDGCTLVCAFGDGHGAVWERAAVPPLVVGKERGDWLVADLDGDGVVELVVSDPESNLVRLFTRRSLAGADPRFEEAAQIPIPGAPGPLALLSATAPVRRIAVGLLGRTQRKGVVIAELTKSAEGAWSFAAHDFVPLTAGVRALSSADLDGDGRPDLALLVASEGSEGACVMIPVLARAEGGWTALDGFVTGLRPYRIAAADLDGDGRAEIVVSSQNSHHLNLWLACASDKRGFVPGPDLGVGTGPLGLVLADLDGDGVPEILCTNAFSDGVSVIRVR
jgi:hypothetical protein